MRTLRVVTGVSAVCLMAGAAQLPLNFEPNRGQAGPGVEFVCRTEEQTLLLERGGAVATRGKDGTLRIRLVGANPRGRAEGRGRLAGTANYFVGRDPARWVTRVPTYGRVEYREVRRGVDLIYYGNAERLEYDLRVRPGADPRALRMAVDGVQRMAVDADGSLLVWESGRRARWPKPVVYQETGGVRKAVAGRYRVRGKRVGFEIGDYDRTRPLVIDPVLVYGALLGGGNQSTTAGRIAVDSAGDAYVTGWVGGGSGWPVTSGAVHSSSTSGGAFVAKFDSKGALVYSAVLGGSSISQGSDVAVDAAGNAYVAGHTLASDFPTTPGAFQPTAASPFFDTVFAAKLDPSGSNLLYSTFLGSFNIAGTLRMRLDSGGNAYITGTAGNAFPTTPGAYQSTQAPGFLSKLSADGSALVYSTYVGNATDIFQQPRGLAVDANGDAYVVGFTNTVPGLASLNQPVTPGAYQTTPGGQNDLYIFKFDPSGSTLLAATFLGGSGNEDFGRNDAAVGAIDIALDSAGSVWVTGTTESKNFPVTANATRATAGQTNSGGYDAFVSQLSGDLSQLLYSTYMGCPADCSGTGIAVGPGDAVYVVGQPNASFPVTSDALTTKGAGFLVKYTSGGARVFSTLGAGTSVAVDPAGGIYVSGTGNGTETVTAGAFQGTGGSVYVAKISEGAAPPPPPPPGGGAPQITAVVNGASFQPGMVAGSWITIQGKNFTPPGVTDTWAGAIKNGQLPTVLDGVSVNVSGGNAYIYYVSPTQINAVVPNYEGAGSVLVNVGTSNGSTGQVPETALAAQPAFFLFGNKYAVATHSADGSLAVANGTFAGTTTVPAKPGEYVVLWGTGFGPTAPRVKDGVLTPSDQVYYTAGIVTVTVGGTPATVYNGHGALAPGFAGLYQLAVQIPSNAPDGDLPVVAAIDGVSSPAGVLITVHR